MESVRLKFRWKWFCTWDSITLAGETYTMERPSDILDWWNYMNELFEKWRDRWFEIKSVFYPSRSLFSIKISK